MPLFYYIITGLLRRLLPLITRWQVTGKKKAPHRGAFIVVSNHLSTTDPVLISAAFFPRRLVFLAKEELFRFWGTPLIRAYGAIPVRKNQLDRHALRLAARVLERGQGLGIFPEGHRSVTCQLQPAYLGVAFVAFKYQVPVLPVAITGSQRLMTWGVLRRPALTIRFGELIPPPSQDGKVTKEKLESYTKIVMERIAELLPPAYRGVYGGSSNEN